MAFAGMFLGTVFLIIVLVIYFIAFVELIVGIVLLVKKKKAPGIVLLVLSAIPIVVTVVALLVLYFQAEFPKYDTYDGGTVTICREDIRVMTNIIRSKDMEGLAEYIDKHPELIYYQDNNHQTLLEYGLHDRNVEIMQIALDHGAKFDAKPTFKLLVYDYSLQNFFSYTYRTFSMSHDPDTPPFAYGESTEEMIEAARFAIENGAETTWEDAAGEEWTFADTVESWVYEDGVLSDTDKEFILYLRSVCGGDRTKITPTREYFASLDKSYTRDQIVAEIGTYSIEGSGILYHVWHLNDGSKASVIFDSNGEIVRIYIDNDELLYVRE